MCSTMQILTEYVLGARYYSHSQETEQWTEQSPCSYWDTHYRGEAINQHRVCQIVVSALNKNVGTKARDWWVGENILLYQVVNKGLFAQAVFGWSPEGKWALERWRYSGKSIAARSRCRGEGGSWGDKTLKDKGFGFYSRGFSAEKWHDVGMFQKQFVDIDCEETRGEAGRLEVII